MRNRVKHLVVSVCIFVYKLCMWSKVTAVSHLSAQKTSPNLVCWCVFAFTCHPTCPLLLVIKHYSSVYYLYTRPYGQPPRVNGSIYAHSYCQPILVRFSAQCIQHTGLCVPWTLVDKVFPLLLLLIIIAMLTSEDEIIFPFSGLMTMG